MRQHAPRAAATQDVEDAVDQFAIVVFAGPPARQGLREEVFDVIPLEVREIAWI